MKVLKKLSSLALACCMACTMLFTAAGATEENPGLEIEVQPYSLAIDTYDGAQSYSKKLYLYEKYVEEDGTVIAGLTDNPALADVNWNVAIQLYAKKTSGRTYKVQADAYHNQVLIAGFSCAFNFGDGSNSGTIKGVMQAPLTDGLSNYCIASTTHTYLNAGSYSISLKSCTLTVADYVTPSVSEPANTTWAPYTIKVT